MNSRRWCLRHPRTLPLLSERAEIPSAYRSAVHLILRRWPRDPTSFPRVLFLGFCFLAGRRIHLMTFILVPEISTETSHSTLIQCNILFHLNISFYAIAPVDYWFRNPSLSTDEDQGWNVSRRICFQRYSIQQKMYLVNWSNTINPFVLLKIC